MSVKCQGKQGAAVYWDWQLPQIEIYEPSLDLNDPPVWQIGENVQPGKFGMLFQSTPIRVEDRQILLNPELVSTWRVYTIGQGLQTPSYQGVHTIRNNQSFCFSNYLNSTQSRRTRMYVCGTSGTIRTITRYHSLHHLEFSHGSYPQYSRQLTITSAEGFIAFDSAISSNASVVTHCGCAHGDCQRGTFPLKYCCYSCLDAKRWLTQVRDDSEFYKHRIQEKLGFPLTYNPR